ncbi:acetyl-CoA hydrolase [Pseudomonas reinekei]|jgi:acetyl-CoA hydrolase|uniref:Acetyl-CoA hydrolase n=2 Tax=Pseudomonas TaxID=286 RepID=D2I933_PSERE|nr:MULTISPECIES: acetyl-CoA hydrolase/transferase C-terminal domain-containing protein [Pseudomonas]ACZ63616.1 acetyl-CoA hydrolase/transferase [Pseudomonas reinekei]KAB0488371.1 acetyl-CoA hydrolase/transferase family protein [Pseudomonas reinekei]KAB0509934.1 acetyl-CoA hydrolase/transferase family protein [Pseudomonas moorei]OLU05858.1 acetyl-CoA hydrolase [Pseudomonas reinekei]SDP67552.1 acetyl-CoA hydrolase [Pseudomonas reinekei]
MPLELQANAPDLSSLIRPGDTVLWGQANAEPLTLTRALMAQRHDFKRIRVLLGIANSDTCRPEHADAVDFLAYCGAGANRALADAGVLDILACHYSEMASQLSSGQLRVDVLMLQLSPADANGRHSLSLASEYLLCALEQAAVVIGEVNQQAPWTYGERTLGLDELDAVVYTDRAPLASESASIREVDMKIARNIADLVEDGSTLQTGIGAIPDAVLSALNDHHNLGVHSGSIGDGVMRLMQSGVVNNSRKSRDAWLSVGGVLIGSQALAQFAHRNRSVHMRSSAYTHDAQVLASLDRLVAINSAVEVDLTGQVNSEVAAGSYLGAVGGSLDFIRGAHRSRGGLPIIALPSSARSNSRIVARLNGPTTIPRSDAGLIVTEFGVADLRGLTMKQRVDKMLSIAAPQHRADLEAAWARGGLAGS